MVIQNTLFLVLLLSLQTITSLCFSEEIPQAHASIKEAALAFVTPKLGNYGRSKVSLGQIDPRFRVTKCSKPLVVSFLSNEKVVGNTTLLIKCTRPKPWKIYLSVKIRKFNHIVTAAQNISQNEVITSNLVTTVEHDVSHLPYGYYTSVDSVLGKQSARSILIGTILNPTNLKLPFIVSRGESVTIIAQTHGITVRSEGKALANGVVNQKISVQNNNSKKIIEGIIIARGIVKVQL